MLFTIIGIPDTLQKTPPPEASESIRNGKVFSGGRRHHELVAGILPENSVWIDITVPLTDVFCQYSKYQEVVVFASGDPLFFGFANTLRREFPEAEITLYPYFNSLQTLAHRLLLPYHDMRIVSLTGRPWHELDRALIEGSEKIGVLTDGKHTPSAIARRMTEYGFTEYEMTVGEHLGNPELENITHTTLAEASRKDFTQPNCLILEGTHRRRWGIPDSEFTHLPGRPRMMTKMPIRLLSLQALELAGCHTFWDIGFCTGSVSIEAKLQFPHLNIVAFEIRHECKDIMAENMRKFSSPGIDVVMGDFMEADLSSLPSPEAVFIGGHGGRLAAIMQRVAETLKPGGTIVMNSVSKESKDLFIQSCAESGLEFDETPFKISLNDYNPIEILRCRKSL